MSTVATLSTAARTAAANAVVDLLDVGTGAATGKVVIKSAGGTTLATLLLTNPAFGAASSGVATAAAIADCASAAASGDAATADFCDRDANVIFTVMVGTSGAGLNLNTVSIVSGTKVSITGFTFTQPAS